MAAYNRRQLIALILLILRRRRRRKAAKYRTSWERRWISRRPELGYSSRLLRELQSEDEEYFRLFCRMQPDIFFHLLHLIRSKIEREDTSMRQAISAKDRLMITLRYLSTGETFRSLSFQFRVGERTVSEIVKDTCAAIFDQLKSEYMKVPSTEEEWQAISDKFLEKWNYPMCIGAIDGKHVAIQQPANSGSSFFNYKGFFSMVLMALVDADYKFLYIDVGSNGKCGDAGIFENSILKKKLENGDLNIPGPKNLPGTGDKCHYHIIGDDAFPLLHYLIKPYSSRCLEHPARIFNYRLSRARRVVENAFGILSTRFRFLFTKINVQIEDVETLVLAACALHNFLIVHQPGLHLSSVDKEESDNLFMPGNWRLDTQNLTNLQATKKKNSASSVKNQRDLLKFYFNSSLGSVPWQNEVLEDVMQF